MHCLCRERPLTAWHDVLGSVPNLLVLFYSAHTRFQRGYDRLGNRHGLDPTRLLCLYTPKMAVPGIAYCTTTTFTRVYCTTNNQTTTTIRNH
ncbi:hypothetical protein PDIG_71460 [Penicillium digitatum PHI26]|uniref:Uncharacterized protein n=2 Tax=Penicillium digitatum TaxID=36651 RepID=K9G351_PEND2|nr:hypothetical protein PDIP_80760 [Penicillium digitatum Pd1]EKV06046.1 hypothetical protein PDIP_80760 [Penicillium digitatum Pd1]EKV07716.1 hypothetical protein PDIG_71460 [Penicillium digitatum PHI26]